MPGGDGFELVQPGQKGIDDIRIEVRAAPFTDNRDRLLERQRRFVSAPGD